VCAGYVEKLLPVFKNADARMMLLSFANREVTHMLGYKRLNDTLGYDSEGFMQEFLSYKEMSDKHAFMIEQANLRSNKGVAEYLAKQILMEGVNLFASFAMLLNYSRLGQLPGMVSVNQWSIIDESLHVEGLTELFRIFVEENPSVVTEEFKRNIYDTARTVVSLEDAFLYLCYSIDEPKNLPIEGPKAFIRFVCDYRMQQMGFKPQWNIEKNPLPFVEEITGDGVLGNFFETTITAYSKDSLVGEWEY
jgi:ribonucleoside-diphosphate reductase beta chain